MAGIFTRSRARCTFTRKSLLVGSLFLSPSPPFTLPPLSLSFPYVSRVHMRAACVKRDVATQAGMQFRNARVAHEASPTLPPNPSRTLVLSSLQEETGDQGGDGYQEGTRWNSLSRISSQFLHKILSSSFPSSPSLFVIALVLSFSWQINLSLL